MSDANVPPPPSGSTPSGPEPTGPIPAEPTPSSPPPGWYPDPTGTTRWWDGSAWGQAAAPTPAAQPYGMVGQAAYGPGSSNSRSMAMLANLLALFTGFLGPLIIMLTTGKQDPWVREQSVEALNFQITLLFAYLISFVLMFVLVGFVLIFGVIICAYVFPIIAAVKCNQGEAYRYPISIRLVS